MRLTDIMSNMDLAVYPTVALIIFAAVFAAVVVRVLARPAELMRRHAAAALEDGPFSARVPGAQPDHSASGGSHEPA